MQYDAGGFLLGVLLIGARSMYESICPQGGGGCRRTSGSISMVEVHNTQGQLALLLAAATLVYMVLKDADLPLCVLLGV